jgi:hypothetical protein
MLTNHCSRRDYASWYRKPPMEVLHHMDSFQLLFCPNWYALPSLNVTLQLV